MCLAVYFVISLYSKPFPVHFLESKCLDDAGNEVILFHSRTRDRAQVFLREFLILYLPVFKHIQRAPKHF